MRATVALVKADRPAGLDVQHRRPQAERGRTSRAMNGLFRRWRKKMSDNLTKRDQRDRSKINMHEDFEVKYWTKALGVSRDELQKAFDKVGISAAAVRKQLAV